MLIVIKYLGPTNTKGARMKISDGQTGYRPLVIPWPGDLCEREAHIKGLKSFLIENRVRNFGYSWYGSYHLNGDYCFISTNPELGGVKYTPGSKK